MVNSASVASAAGAREEVVQTHVAEVKKKRYYTLTEAFYLMQSLTRKREAALREGEWQQTVSMVTGK